MMLIKINPQVFKRIKIHSRKVENEGVKKILIPKGMINEEFTIPSLIIFGAKHPCGIERIRIFADGKNITTTIFHINRHKIPELVDVRTPVMKGGTEIKLSLRSSVYSQTIECGLSPYTRILMSYDIEEDDTVVYSNYNHKLMKTDDEVKESGKTYAHSGWNFCGEIYFDSKSQKFKERVWQRLYVSEIMEADTLKELIEKSNAKYGDD
tara:strand:+ start:2081 stop:2707 length:627 start_codon:yes stop_codon:yes gene_type:complete